MKKILAITTLAASMVLSSVAAFADTSASTTSGNAGVTSTTCTLENPQKFTQDVINHKIIAVLLKEQSSSSNGKLDQKKVQLSVENSLKPYIAINQMCSFVAGPVFNNASPAEKAAFEEAFYQFIANLYGGALADFDNQKVVVSLYLVVLPFVSHFDYIQDFQIM